jgi:3D (Asp-Asp-Asp) domain-containing protein
MKFLLTLSLFAASSAFAADRGAHPDGRYIATAYSVTGITASGIYTNRHVVAADPSILPIGTIVKIRHAGKYQGEYVVADTGRKIVGRRLDIYMPSTAACMKFGKKAVKVKIVKVGNGTHQETQAAAHEVNEHIASDLRNGVVGNAATQADWVTQNGPAKAAAIHQDSAEQDTAGNSRPQTPQH